MHGTQRSILSNKTGALSRAQRGGSGFKDHKHKAKSFSKEVRSFDGHICYASRQLFQAHMAKSCLIEWRNSEISKTQGHFF